jgi:hypothetical protein
VWPPYSGGIALRDVDEAVIRKGCGEGATNKYRDPGRGISGHWHRSMVFIMKSPGPVAMYNLACLITI